MDDKAFRMTMLFDFYGDLLTDRQKELFDLYYNDDLSLAEISENVGISRQGVRDALVHAEGVMTRMEERTGMVARFLQVRKLGERIADLANQISDLNDARYISPELGRMCQDLLDCAQALKE